MNKIIMTPLWNDAHFFPMWLRNMCDIIEPQTIVLNEGLFPTGMEDHGWDNYDEYYFDHFTHKPSHPDIISFDVEDIYREVNRVRKEFPHIDIKVNHIQHQVPKEFKWPQRLQYAYQTALSFDLPPNVVEGDILILGEVDMFHHENDKEVLEQLFEELKPGAGIMFKMRRFFISPFVEIMDKDAEHDKIRSHSQGKVVKWKDGTTWNDVFRITHWGKYDGWYHATYDGLLPYDFKDKHRLDYPLINMFHYEWIRPRPRYFENKKLQLRNREEVWPIYDYWCDYIHEHGRVEDGSVLEGGKAPQGWLYNVEDETPKHFKEHVDYDYFKR